MSKYGQRNIDWFEAIVNKLGGEEGAERFLRGEVVIKEPSVLRRIASVQAPGVKKFVAKDALKSANVGWTNDNFKTLFLDKVEENVGDAVIAVHNLERASKDAPILTELGARTETKLAHFFGLLEKQSKGEPGTLLVNGWANIAYIMGNDGNIWIVRAYWTSVNRYWDVWSCSVDDPREWRAGGQVFSRDC